MPRQRTKPLSPLGKVVQHHLRKQKKKQNQVAAKLGVSDNAFNKWLNGEGITSDNLKALSEELQIPMDDLVNGIIRDDPVSYNGDLDIFFADEHDAYTTLEPGPRLARSAKLPVVGGAQLGEGYRAELEYPIGHGDGYIEYATKDSQAYALRCRGNSMAPRIKDGEFVVIEPNHPVMDGDEVLVKCIKGRVMVKVLERMTEEFVYLKSINDSYPTISIPIAEIESMQYVAAIVKSAKWMPD